MKIAYLFAYFGEGGAEEHAILLAEKAKESGHDPLFLISDYSNLAMDRIKKAGFKVMSLNMKSSFNLLSVLKSATKLKKIIESEQIDIVHAHMLREQSLSIIAKLFGAKFVLIRTYHRFDQFNWKMRPLLPIYKRFTDAVISISKSMSEYLYQNGLTDRVHLIENGVDEVKVVKHRKALGFIGRLTEEKGILKFIESNIDILRKNKLVIAGDGPDTDAIKQIVKKNGLNVELLGKVDDKSDFFEKISVLILPSRTEVLPLVVLEAYSCGLPVVAFKMDQLKFLVGKDNGVLVKKGDYKQMAEKSVGLIARSNSFKKANITKYKSQYSIDAMWAKTNKLYLDMIND